MSYLKTAFLLGLLTALLVGIGGAVGGRGGMVVALLMAGVMNLGAYWFSDKIVLARYRAHETTPEQAPRMHAIVDRLCARSGLPKPRVFVIPEASPNAFATGRNPHHAAIAATAGILQLMDDEELEGVLAHELSHVGNRDILISSVAATIAGGVMILASMARWGAIFGGFGGGDDRRGGNPLAMLAAAIFAPIAASIIQLAVSRSREYGADKSGAALTGNPEGLARALEKLGVASGRIPMQADPSTAHMFIVKPSGGFSLAGLFSTHPPLPERIRRLREMASR